MAEKQGSGKLVLGLVLVVGLVLGAAVGVFVVAPRLSGVLGASGAGYAEPIGDFDHGGGEGGRGGRSGSPGDLYTVDNLVVNPAGTKGTRFLMTTVVFEVRTQSVVEELRRREAQVRDALLTLLSSKTVEELVDVEARDTLRNELRDVVLAMVPRAQIGAVYFSHYVIQ
ncbi:MAG TPA: flagellar basal body-associated FliL family protein [Longimicrobiales bacterium]|nr:flagellar basal body-associated FliL family protein [Longimicrobiales bacterium]